MKEWLLTLAIKATLLWRFAVEILTSPTVLGILKVWIALAVIVGFIAAVAAIVKVINEWHL